LIHFRAFPLHRPRHVNKAGAGIHRFAAFIAYQRGLKIMVMPFMLQPDRGTLSPPGSSPFVTPLPQGNDDRPEVASLLGQPVFVADGRFLIADLLQDTVFDERGKAQGQRAGRHAGLDADAIVSTLAEEDLAQDDEGPRVYQLPGGPGNRAVAAVDGCSFHRVAFDFFNCRRDGHVRCMIQEVTI